MSRPKLRKPVPEGYRLLKRGERLQKGDIGLTWADLECTYIDWVEVHVTNFGDRVETGLVPCARKIV